MATGITVNGVDLDSIFKARVSAKRADVEFEVAGTDISNRYEPANTLSKSKITYNTGFIANGSDLKDLFMDKNYNPFNLTLNWSIVQYSADCWQIYISSSLSVKCRLNFRLNGNLGSQTSPLTFNPADGTNGYRKFNVINLGAGTQSLFIDTVDVYNTAGTSIYKTYGIGKSYGVPSNNWRGDDNTVAKFTIGNTTQSNMGSYYGENNTYTTNKATVTFATTFASLEERP
jgi:hypothetical protein